MIPNYHDFVVERHRIWERRQLGYPAPFSANPVLRAKKFTNVFRVLDAGTQFVVESLLPRADAATTVLRCFLYRYTNRPEPWIAWAHETGDFPDFADLKSGELLAFWRAYQASGGGIFGPAYQMFVGQENKGLTRLDWALGHTVKSLCSGTLVDRYIDPAMSVAERVALLQTLPRCGPFMAMQITTDYGYSVHGQHDENEYILAGPGARAGVLAYNGGRDAEAVIRQETYRWKLRGDVTLYGRTPSLMDVQNTFCEYSKYARACAKLPAPHLVYKGHGQPVAPTLPTHWGTTA